MLAITDHAEGTVSGVGREPLLEQRERIRALQAQVGDAIVLLHGVELNIGPNGELDWDLEFRRGFDWCLASVHDHFDLDRDALARFEEAVAPVDGLALSLTQAIRTLREARDLLLPRLMSGEIDIEDLEIAVAEAAA